MTFKDFQEPVLFSWTSSLENKKKNSKDFQATVRILNTAPINQLHMLACQTWFLLLSLRNKITKTFPRFFLTMSEDIPWCNKYVTLSRLLLPTLIPFTATYYLWLMNKCIVHITICFFLLFLFVCIHQAMITFQAWKHIETFPQNLDNMSFCLDHQKIPQLFPDIPAFLEFPWLSEWVGTVRE